LSGHYNKEHSVYLESLFFFHLQAEWKAELVFRTAVSRQPCWNRIRVSVVYVTVKTRAGKESSHGSITGRGKAFLSSAVCPYGLWAPPSLIFREYSGLFALLGFYTALIESYLPTFRHNPSFPPSIFKQPRKNLISLLK
jgi:hypothetical protein